jgi:general nucleoside transport system permease protein
MDGSSASFASVLMLVIAGAIRVGTPFLFVSLGEMLTEKSGRINLGLEANLVMGAMAGYALSLHSGNPWIGVLCAGLTGVVLSGLHAALCSLKGVNDIAVGIAIMIFGVGLAFFLGKPYIQPSAPMLPSIDFGGWSSNKDIRSALQINPLFLVGVLLLPLLTWALKNTRWGLMVRLAGENAEAATAMGYSVRRIRALSTMAGGFLAGVGGAFLSLFYPGSWNEGLSSGQGLMAVALVIFARWQPVNCFYAALLFGGAGALAPALQAVGITWGYYLFNAAPYILTLVIMAVTCSRQRSLAGMPAQLGERR